MQRFIVKPEITLQSTVQHCLSYLSLFSALFNKNKGVVDENSHVESTMLRSLIPGRMCNIYRANVCCVVFYCLARAIGSVQYLLYLV